MTALALALTGLFEAGDPVRPRCTTVARPGCAAAEGWDDWDPDQPSPIEHRAQRPRHARRAAGHHAGLDPPSDPAHRLDDVT